MTNVDTHAADGRHQVVVCGYSDDVVELDGAIYDEVYTYGKPDRLVLLDRDSRELATLDIEYSPDGSGYWRITNIDSLVEDTSVTIEHTPARGEDEDDDEHGCPGYSDKVIVKAPHIGSFTREVVKA